MNSLDAWFTDDLINDLSSDLMNRVNLTSQVQPETGSDSADITTPPSLNSCILQAKRLDLTYFSRGESSRSKLTTRLPDDLLERVKNFAELNCLSLNTAIMLLLDSALEVA